jgi:hypothetical protein
MSVPYCQKCNESQAFDDCYFKSDLEDWELKIVCEYTRIPLPDFEVICDVCHADIIDQFTDENGEPFDDDKIFTEHKL